MGGSYSGGSSQPLVTPSSSTRRVKRSRLRYASGMDVLQMLAQLQEERRQLEEAIVTLERMTQGRGKRRWRPPAWMASVSKRRGRPPGSKNKPKE